MIKQKQSLIHKVPSGVILSHMCSVAAISSTLIKCKYLSKKYGETRNSSLLSVEIEMGVAT